MLKRHPLLTAVLGIWLSWIVLVAVQFFYWRIYTLRPNPWLWLVLTLIVVFGPPALYVFGLTQIDRHRIKWLPFLAAALLGTVPLLAAGVYFAQTLGKAHHRGNMVLTPALNLTGWWAMGAAEFNMRLRYDVQAVGRHVELIQADPTPHAQAYVNEMDRHVEDIAEVLGQPIAPGRIVWARGSVLGFNGRAMYGLAICRDDRSSPGYLDYHEIAHCVITKMAGPDHQPSMLLAEGFAQAFSAADLDEFRDRMIRHLHKAKTEGHTVPLSDWVSPENYGRSVGPAYSHGGPLVVYLLEHYGGEKFFELYQQIRIDTVSEDCQRVLGVSWDEMERDFWAWLENESSLVSLRRYH
ncbi:MAG: hypothetical protein AAGH99_08020 [Planctomycetota bacterium]